MEEEKELTQGVHGEADNAGGNCEGIGSAGAAVGNEGVTEKIGEIVGAAAADTRSTPPGCTRLLITLSVVLSFLLAVPAWWKSTEVYRAPLPFSAIQEHATELASSAFALPCHLHIIFAVNPKHTQRGSISEKSLEEISYHIQKQTQNLVPGNQSNSTSGCLANFEVLVTLDDVDTCVRVGNIDEGNYWPCGLANSGLHEIMHLSNDSHLDEFFWDFSKGESSSTGGRYTVVVLERRPSQEIGGHLSEQRAAGIVSNQRTVVGKYRHAWINGVDWSDSGFEKGVASRIADVAVTYFRNGGLNSKSGGTEEDHMASLPFSADGEAILSLSLLNADPEDWIFDWNIKEVEERYLRPLIEVMEPVARLSVESQVLYYTPKAVLSHWDDALKAYVVPSKQLPFFVNSNEWHLDTSSAATGQSKLLNFAIYVPASYECPLHMQLSSGRVSPTNGFTSPGWGGIIVYNPPSCESFVTSKFDSYQLTTKDLEPAVGVIVAQIRALFGLPPTFVENTQTNTFGVPAAVTGIADWEVDVLLRRRSAMDVHASASTLASLSRLVGSLPNMVIKDEIGDQVQSSLAQAKAAQTYSVAGSYHSAAEAARRARSWAEAAFFQPSIMSLLYFPREHQLAIYTPFFVPVLLHLLVAVVKEGSRYTREYKKYQRGLEKKI